MNIITEEENFFLPIQKNRKGPTRKIIKLKENKIKS